MVKIIIGCAWVFIDDFICSNDIKDYLENKDEEPVTVTGRCIRDMTKKYREYRKVSISIKSMQEIKLPLFLLSLY